MIAFEMYQTFSRREVEMMNMKVENLPKYRIAYVRQVGPSSHG